MEEAKFVKEGELKGMGDKEIKMEKYLEEKPKEPSMKEKVDEIYSSLKDKKKKIKIPRKAKVRRGRIKKGWVGTIYIDENRNIKGFKEKVEGGCFREKKDIRYHSTEGEEILFWEGKFPVILQPTWRKNPLNVNKIASKTKDEKGYLVNETYGQKYIMARMLADVIKIKKKGGLSLILILALIVGGYILYTMFTGG